MDGSRPAAFTSARHLLSLFLRLVILAVTVVAATMAARITVADYHAYRINERLRAAETAGFVDERALGNIESVFRGSRIPSAVAGDYAQLSGRFHEWMAYASRHSPEARDEALRAAAAAYANLVARRPASAAAWAERALARYRVGGYRLAAIEADMLQALRQAPYAVDVHHRIIEIGIPLWPRLSPNARQAVKKVISHRLVVDRTHYDRFVDDRILELAVESRRTYLVEPLVDEAGIRHYLDYFRSRQSSRP
jgi:hypothetical protein